MRSDRLVRALLRLYPRAWRERYGEEFFALIAQSPVTPRVVVDVCLAALVERWHVATNWSALPIDDGAALFAFAILLACIGRGWRGAFPIAAPRQPLTLRAIVSIYLGV